MLDNSALISSLADISDDGHQRSSKSSPPAVPMAPAVPPAKIRPAHANDKQRDADTHCNEPSVGLCIHVLEPPTIQTGENCDARQNNHDQSTAPLVPCV